MTIFQLEQRRRIEDAIRKAESGTSAEFLCAVTRSSDTYFAMPLLIAALLGITVPALVLHALPGWTVIGPHDPVAVLLQVLCFAALALILVRPAIAARLTPRAVRQRRAARFATAVFLERGLAGVGERNGVLLFVSLAEHHVEVIADRGVYSRVDPAEWLAIVEAFTTEVRRGDTAGAFVAALERLATVLAAAYPRRPDDVNEIPDRLIELD
ncbi:MAG: hypothetical protein FJX57_18075 [Alphaproteobacteria bacterium]|nr:hypothetical protein [Alphaproteobacteria bacterium]